MPMYCHRITISYFRRISSNKKNKCITINDKNDTTLYHETENVKSKPSSDLSGMSQFFEVVDIQGFSQSIKGFDKPDFYKVVSIDYSQRQI